MISIGMPYVNFDDTYAYLRAKVTVSDDTASKWVDFCKKNSDGTGSCKVDEDYPPEYWRTDSTLYFRVEKQYADGLCAERGDAFVIAMLYYAMATGSDILSEAPVSSRLFFGIEYNLIPVLCDSYSGFDRIHVKADTISEPYPNKGYVGTGMSCGIDSLHTFYKYSKDTVPQEYRITHLLHMNMGSIFYVPESYDSVKEYYALADKKTNEKRAKAENVAADCGVPLISVKSNIDEDFYRGMYIWSNLYRNCALVFAMQGYFSKYYCASAGYQTRVYIPVLSDDSARYEILFPEVFSSDSLHIIINQECRRYEKLVEILDWKIAKKYLDVCCGHMYKGRDNCGVCVKCWRTLLMLDSLDRIEEYSEVFDLKEFYKNRMGSYFRLFDNMRDHKIHESTMRLSQEIYKIAMQNNRIPHAYFKYYKAYKRNQIPFVKTVKRPFKFLKDILLNRR